MKGAERHLYSVHNPTGTNLSFLLPLFTNPAGDNHLHIQNLDFNDTVARFQILSGDLPAEQRPEQVVARLGHPAIHAFQVSPAESLIGTREEIKPRLVSLLDEHDLIKSPLLRFHLTDFCRLTNKISDAAKEAYSYLKSISKFSADQWRDRTLLSAITRLSLMQTLRYSNPISSLDAPWDSVHLSLAESTPRLFIPATIQPILTGSRWKSRLRLDLAPYARAFDVSFYDIELIVRSPTGEAVARQYIGDRAASRSALDNGENDFRAADWLVLALGKRSTSAAKGLRHYPKVAIMPPISDHDDFQNTLKLISEGNTSRDIPQTVLIIFDTPFETPQTAQILLSQLPKNARVIGVGLYKIGERRPNQSELFFDSMSRLVIIPDGEAQNSNNSRQLPLRNTVRELFRFLEDLPHATPEPGISVFSASYDRRGIRAANSTIRSAMAAAANDLLPPSLFKQARIEIASVGKPDPESMYEDTLNSCLSTLSHLPAKFEWQKRRFISGAPIGVTTGILFDGEFSLQPTEQFNYQDAAQTIFRSLGYRVESSDDYRFIVIGSSDSLTVAMGREHKVSEEQTYVRLVSTRKEQIDAIQEETSHIAIPLTLNDLHFFSGVTSLKTAAQVLGILAHERKQWPSVLRSAIEEALWDSFRKSERRFRLIDALEDQYTSPEITEVEVEIENIVRVGSRAVRISGKTNIGFSYDADGDSEFLENTILAIFSAEIRPTGIRIEDVRMM